MKREKNDSTKAVCLGNDEPSEYSGAKQARKILEQAAALFASGTMTNEDKIDCWSGK